MKSKKDIVVAQSLLQGKKNIVIIPHRNPDGDAIGSTLGLCLFLRKMGHSALVLSPNSYPDFLAWMPNSSEIVVYEDNISIGDTLLDKADLIFNLDFNALHRVGEKLEAKLKTLSQPFLMIDHHQQPDEYPTYIFSDTKYGSTCEMIYHFIDLLGQLTKLDKDIATCLYTGIVTDTGSFKFSSTTSTTHRVVASLIDLGVNSHYVHTSLFDNNSVDRLLILGKALQNLVVIPEFQTSYITLSQEELNKLNFKKGDTEGIVNYGLTIKGIIFTAIFIENKEEGIIKISFRSQSDFDVNAFARKYFNGGGHINAAGGKSVLNLQDTVTEFLRVLNETNLKLE